MHRSPAHRSRRRQTARRRRSKAVLGLAVVSAAMGGAQAGATLARSLPFHDALPAAFLDQPLWLFVAGLLVGLWLQHERSRPEPKLPFPFVVVRRGISSVPRRREPLE